MVQVTNSLRKRCQNRHAFHTKKKPACMETSLALSFVVDIFFHSSHIYSRPKNLPVWKIDSVNLSRIQNTSDQMSANVVQTLELKHTSRFDSQYTEVQFNQKDIQTSDVYSYKSMNFIVSNRLYSFRLGVGKKKLEPKYQTEQIQKTEPNRIYELLNWVLNFISE